MKCSIIFVNYKSKNLVRQNLQALRSFAPDNTIETIVVDNASHDGVGQMIKEHFSHPLHPVKFIPLPDNKGFAYGVNRGIQESTNEYCLIMNPDVVVAEQATERLVNFMESHPAAGIAGPRLRQPDGSVQPSCFAFPSFLTPLYRRTPLKKIPYGRKQLETFVLDANKNAAHAVKAAWIQGSCMIIRKSALAEVGLMDEHFFMYFEDTDWCRRFIEKGWEVWYVPEAEMVHYFNRWSAEYEGMGALFNPATWIHVKSWLYYFWKWRKSVRTYTICL